LCRLARRPTNADGQPPAPPEDVEQALAALWEFAAEDLAPADGPLRVCARMCRGAICDRAGDAERQLVCGADR
jgi:hypothetical protein